MAISWSFTLALQKSVIFCSDVKPFLWTSLSYHLKDFLVPAFRSICGNGPMWGNHCLGEEGRWAGGRADQAEEMGGKGGKGGTGDESSRPFIYIWNVLKPLFNKARKGSSIGPKTQRSSSKFLFTYFLLYITSNGTYGIKEKNSNALPFRHGPEAGLGSCKTFSSN